MTLYGSDFVKVGVTLVVMEASRGRVGVAVNDFSHLVSFSRSEREVRHRRKEKLCHFYVKGFTRAVAFMVTYVLFGYFGKWLWYHADMSAVDYNPFDWEQLIGALIGFWLSLGFYVAVFWYCPVCTRYSTYDRNEKRSRQFWWYQFLAMCWILVFVGLAELVEVVYSD